MTLHLVTCHGPTLIAAASGFTRIPGWLGVAVAAVVLAPGASVAESVTVSIDDVTPPLASVDAGGRVTFVNAIEGDTVSVSVPSIGLLPARFASSAGSADAASRGSASGGGGGVAGADDGASVPVFGHLAGIAGASLDDRAAGEELADPGAAAQALPAAALAAVVALATATAALVRTHRASRTSRR